MTLPTSLSLSLNNPRVVPARFATRSKCQSIFIYILSITQKIVVIRGIEPVVFREMLAFIYSDETPNIKEVADKLFQAADLVKYYCLFWYISFFFFYLTQYDVQPLRARCVLEMQRGISVENVAALLSLSVGHSLDVLKQHALRFLHRFVTNFHYSYCKSEVRCGPKIRNPHRTRHQKKSRFSQHFAPHLFAPNYENHL